MTRLTNAYQHALPVLPVSKDERVTGDLERPLLWRADVVRCGPALDLVSNHPARLVHGVRAEVTVYVAASSGGDRLGVGQRAMCTLTWPVAV
jgi:hypothetical protein